MTVPEVVLYRRSSCPFCVSLIRGLRRAGVQFREVDIWAEPEGAAFVRAAAGGNETVPTVDIAGTVLVNPPAAVVLAHALEVGIALEPLAPPPPAGPPGGAERRRGPRTQAGAAAPVGTGEVARCAGGVWQEGRARRVGG